MANSDSESDNSQSSSSDDQQNTTTGAEGANTLALSRSSGNTISSSITNNTLDAGAVSKSFDFAKSMGKEAFVSSIDSTDKLYKTAKSAMTGMADAYETAAKVTQKTTDTAMSEVAGAYKNTASTLNDAYQTAKAGEQKLMAAGALAVVAIVAVKVLGK